MCAHEIKSNFPDKKASLNKIIDYAQLNTDIVNAVWLNSFVKFNTEYRKSSNIRRTKNPNINVFRVVLQLFLPNPMRPGVKSRMKM